MLNSCKLLCSAILKNTPSKKLLPHLWQNILLSPKPSTNFKILGDLHITHLISIKTNLPFSIYPIFGSGPPLKQKMGVAEGKEGLMMAKLNSLSAKKAF